MKNNILLVIILYIVFSQNLSAQNFREEEKTFELDKNTYVSIKTYKGSIKVETWDKAEIFVHVKIEADDEGWSNTDPEEQLENVKIKYDVSSNQIRIESKYDKKHGFWGSETRALVHYNIKMPKTVNLNIDDYKSETEIINLNADIKIETYKGKINITGLKGGIDLDTYKGEAVIKFDELKRNCILETFKGNIELELSASSKFDLDIELNRNGNFECAFDYSSNGRVNEDYIRAKVNGGGPVVEFETSKGRLIIAKK